MRKSSPHVWRALVQIANSEVSDPCQKNIYRPAFVSLASVVPICALLRQESFISLFIFIICVRRGISWPRNKNRMRLRFSKTKAKRKKSGRFRRTGSQTRGDIKRCWSLREGFQTSDRDGVWTGFRHENYVALGHPLTVIYDATTFTHWHVIIWLKRGEKKWDKTNFRVSQRLRLCGLEDPTYEAYGSF